MKGLLVRFIAILALISPAIFAAPATADFNLGISIGGLFKSSQDPAPTQDGPPPWAPAHGRRAKYEYKYYPDAQVYFDPARTSWFYLESGNWMIRASLPDRLRVSLGGEILLGMDVDKPYIHHKDVTSRHPVKAKMKAKTASGGGKGKARSKGKGRKK